MVKKSVSFSVCIFVLIWILFRGRSYTPPNYNWVPNTLTTEQICTPNKPSFWSQVGDLITDPGPNLDPYNDFALRMTLSGDGSMVAIAADNEAVRVGSSLARTGHKRGMIQILQLNEYGQVLSRRGNVLLGINFGWSLAMSQDGKTIAAASNEGVYVYRWDNNGGNWKQVGDKIVIKGEMRPRSLLSLSSNGTVIAITEKEILSPGPTSVFALTDDGNTVNWIPKGQDVVVDETKWVVSMALNGNGDILVATGTLNSNERFRDPYLEVFKYNQNDENWISIFFADKTTLFDEWIPEFVDISKDASIIAVGAGPSLDSQLKMGRVFVLEQQGTTSSSLWNETQSISGDLEELVSGGFQVHLSSDGSTLLAGYLASRNKNNDTKRGLNEGGFAMVYAKDKTNLS